MTSAIQNQGRIVGFDLLKVLSALSVIWIHTPETDGMKQTVVWCRFAVPLFTLISIYLLLRRLQVLPLREAYAMVFRRAWEVYRFFLVWNLIFLLARFLKHRLVAPGQSIFIDWQGLLVAGFAHHLWFLPFLAMAQVVAGLAGAAVLRCSRRWRTFVILILCAVSLLMAATACPFSVDAAQRPITYFMSLTWLAFPAALLAIPLVWSDDMIKWRDRQNWQFTAALGVSGFICMFFSTVTAKQNLMHVIATFFLACAGKVCPWQTLPRRFSSVVQVLLPVYVIHVLIVEAIQAFGHRLGFPTSPGFDLVNFGLTCVASIALPLLTIRIRALSWLYTMSPVRAKTDV